MLISSSRLIPKIGRFKYVICAGPVFLAIGSGLLYTIDYRMSIKYLLGYQAFLGVGIGLSLQNSMLAIQHELKAEPWLVSAGTGLGVFSTSWSIVYSVWRADPVQLDSPVVSSVSPSRAVSLRT